MLIIPIMLLGIGVALFRRSSHAVVDGAQADAPMRLLRWAAGLLSAQRAEWGQAMFGELDHIEGRGRRWRFAIGCVGAALLLPPWGRAGAAVSAMLAVAIGSLGLYASAIARYGLGAGSWIGAAIALTLLLSFVLAAPALLRRPGAAAPGLLGGLFVALAWLAMSGFTFVNFLTRVLSIWAIPLLWIVVPAVVGVAGTVWGGSAAAGRRTARLAGITAGLAVYLYGTLAVTVLGAGGPPDDSGFTANYIINDRLGNNVVFYLVLLPLVTSTLGWSAAAATAHIRREPAEAAATYVPATSHVSTALYSPATISPRTQPAIRVAVATWPRTARVGVASAAVAGMAFLAFATGLRG